MAEQDREDLVPSVLNDLMDVDGTPADGDALVRQGGVWTPGNQSLPELGPVINQWDGGVSTETTYADNAAILAAWVGNLPTREQLTYPGVHPTMGAWSVLYDDYRLWSATEPGFYTVYVTQWINAVGGDPSNSNVGLGVPKDKIRWSMTGDDREYGAYGDSGFTTYSQLILPISQGMIDGGFAGFVLPAPRYNAGSTDRAVNLNCQIMIHRHSPGSTFDYYGDI